MLWVLKSCNWIDKSLVLIDLPLKWVSNSSAILNYFTLSLLWFTLLVKMNDLLDQTSSGLMAALTPCPYYLLRLNLKRSYCLSRVILSALLAQHIKLVIVGGDTGEKIGFLSLSFPQFYSISLASQLLERIFLTINGWNYLFTQFRVAILEKSDGFFLLSHSVTQNINNLFLLTQCFV